MTYSVSLAAILPEPTWQTLVYQRWAIATVLAVLAVTPFIYLGWPTRHRAGSPGRMTIGIVIALGGFMMTNFTLNLLYRTVAHRNETNATAILGRLYKSELKFKEKQGRFGTLAELAAEGLEGKPLAEGKVILGYIFTSSDVTDTTFCLHADRAQNTSGFRDFNLTETEEYRSIKSELKGTVLRGQGNNAFND